MTATGDLLAGAKACGRPYSLGGSGAVFF